MKTKKAKKSSAVLLREWKLKALIHACLERYSEDEMIQAFNEVTGETYIKDALSELKESGYLIFKPDTTYQENQLREFAESVVFPYVNEQQVCIF
jgi:hypothetical protein